MDSGRQGRLCEIESCQDLQTRIPVITREILTCYSRRSPFHKYCWAHPPWKQVSPKDAIKHGALGIGSIALYRRSHLKLQALSLTGLPVPMST